MESERKRSRRTQTARPRPGLDARPPEPGGIGSARTETLDTRPRARLLPRSGTQATAPRHNFECHADMPTSLRKQLVDRRRVVHGIAIGREQIEHGGHPLDDTGAIVSIHMTLLLIAENNLHGRDGIRAVSDLQQMSSVPFVAKETRDSRNADGITASDDRCKPV